MELNALNPSSTFNPSSPANCCSYTPSSKETNLLPSNPGLYNLIPPARHGFCYRSFACTPRGYRLESGRGRTLHSQRSLGPCSASAAMGFICRTRSVFRYLEAWLEDVGSVWRRSSDLRVNALLRSVDPKLPTGDQYHPFLPAPFQHSRYPRRDLACFKRQFRSRGTHFRYRRCTRQPACSSLGARCTSDAHH